MMFNISKHPRKVTLVATTLALLGAYSWSIGFVRAGESKPVKEKLISRPVELPDSQFNILVRTIEWPVGYKSDPHTHKGPGPRYVLSGKVRIDDQGKVNEYTSGQSFWHPGGFAHTAENIANEPTKVLIVEMLPK